MRRYRFPYLPESSSLSLNDCRIFADRFSTCILGAVPTAGNVRFLLVDLKTFSLDTESDEKRNEQNITARRCPVPDKTNAGALLFPLAVENGKWLVAEVTEIDPMVVEKASPEWLAEIGARVEEALARIKHIALDSLTGFYQAQDFFDIVRRSAGTPDSHIVLVEASPSARSPRDRLAQLQSAASLLKAHNRYRFPQFHLGLGVFALLVEKQPRTFLKTYCLSHITLLKRNGFRRVHCGCRTLSEKRTDRKEPLSGSNRSIDEAWRALETACGRGPFAFCDYETLINPVQPIFRPVPARVRASLRHRCRGLASYAIVCLRPDGKWSEERKKRLGDQVGEQSVAMDGDLLVVLPHKDGTAAKRWVEKIIKKIGADDSSCALSAGISVYPDQATSAAALVKNALKALLHASFLGPGRTVVFDALSLHVSGDAYFSEGDWCAAVKEYRRGLLLAENDTDLLNSLGVTYAMMNRTSAAIVSFQKVLAVEPTNFMACYNCGLGLLETGRFEEAVTLFWQALDNYEESDADEASVYSDLCYHYGISLFKTGEYTRCAEVLEKWREKQKGHHAAGACCRYIGISHYHLQQAPEASLWLQRALAYDESDAESLSLLGALYLELGEGEDIALRLLEKAVEMTDGQNPALMVRWAQALMVCGFLEEARVQFQRCTAKKQTRKAAWLGLRDIYRLQGKDRLAERYQRKVSAADDAEEKGVGQSEIRLE